MLNDYFFDRVNHEIDYFNCSFDAYLVSVKLKHNQTSEGRLPAGRWSRNLSPTKCLSLNLKLCTA